MKAHGCIPALLLVIMVAAGCSTSRIATRAIVPVIENTKDFALSFPDVETFSLAMPSNLFLIEGLIKSDPRNKKLRITASMLYFSYAFSFIEDKNQGYASYLYGKGVEHGRAALLYNKKTHSNWRGRIEDFKGMLKHFRRDDVPAITWTATNWAQLISLHLDSTAVLVDIARVEALLNRACELNGSYFMGLPHIIFGSLYAFRPPMMGGNIDASSSHFEKAFKVSEDFLMAKYFYARYLCYRLQDADSFEKSLKWVLSQPSTILPQYRLLNEIAKEKSLTLLARKDELF